MKNDFGQDIRVGSFVGLGVRKGDSSEQRVGIVLDLFTKIDTYRPNRVSWHGKCAWYDPNVYYMWNAEKEESEAFFRPGKVMISNQMFRFFLLDPASLDPEIAETLRAAYAERMTGSVSTFVPEK